MNTQKEGNWGLLKKMFFFLYIYYFLMLYQRNINEILIKIGMPWQQKMRDDRCMYEMHFLHFVVHLLCNEKNE